MTNVVNLNKVRKAKARKAAKRQAGANSIKFGRTKAEKAQDSAKTEKARQDLDGHKRE